MADTQGHFGGFTAARDRRSHPRKSPSSTIYVELSENNGGIVLDLGEGGLAMTAAAALVGEYYPRMRFRLPNCDHCAETSGRIVWTANSNKRAGFRFVDLTEEARDLIKDWISSDRSPYQVQDALRSVIRKRMQLERPSSSNPRMIIPNRVMIEGAGEMRLRNDLFSSKNAPSHPPEVQPSALISEQTPNTRYDRHASNSILGLGWDAHTKRTDPVTESRGRVRPTAFAGLIVVLCFAIGVTVGNGSFTRLLLNIEKIISRTGESVSETSAAPANSLAGPSGSSAGEVPQQAPKIPAEPSRTSSGPIPYASPNESEGQRAAGGVPSALSNTGIAEKSWTQMRQSQGPILVTAPSEGSQPLLLTLPERPVSASSSFAISSQRFIIVPAEPGSGFAHQPMRLRVGELIFHVEPHYSRVEGQEGENTIKLRATIEEDGQISEVIAISGPQALLPPAISAVRKWRYRPTDLNGQPIRTLEDIVMVFTGG